MPQPLRYEDLNVNVNLCLLEALMPEPSVQQQHNPFRSPPMPTSLRLQQSAKHAKTSSGVEQ